MCFFSFPCESALILLLLVSGLILLLPGVLLRTTGDSPILWISVNVCGPGPLFLGSGSLCGTPGKQGADQYSTLYNVTVRRGMEYVPVVLRDNLMEIGSTVSIKGMDAENRIVFEGETELQSNIGGEGRVDAPNFYIQNTRIQTYRSSELYLLQNPV